MGVNKKAGDLVGCYLTNTEVYDSLIEVGIVVDVNHEKQSILVVTRTGHKMWWNHKRWRLLQKSL